MRAQLGSGPVCLGACYPEYSKPKKGANPSFFADLDFFVCFRN